MPSHGGNNPDYLHAKSLQNDSFKSANRSGRDCPGDQPSDQQIQILTE